VFYQFCSPFIYSALSNAPGVTVPAGGYATVPWPGAFTDVDAGGEVILYKDGNFGSGASIMDFVCWGTNPHGSRKPLAESVGKWSDACALAITGGSIHRLPNTDGTTAASYDVSSAPSPMNCVPTGVGGGVRRLFVLDQNYPNPFNPSTTIAFELESASRARLRIYDVTGKLVRTLVDGRLAAGPHRAAWDGADDRGRAVASGVYYYRLDAGPASATRRMVLLK
jgi:hypothetical protein